jgi:hypothetical protein
LKSRENKSRFDKALADLQAGLKVLPVGVAEAGAWRYAFIYEILPRWLPDVPAKAGNITRSQARQAILDQYLRNRWRRRFDVTTQADTSSTDFRRLLKQICENLCNLRMKMTVTQTQA